jgi:hypothetical protein
LELNSISQRFERYLKGGEFGFQIGSELGLGLTGLGRLRQKSYLESGWEVGYAGLSFGKAKSLSRVVLALPLTSGWVRGLTGLGQLGQVRSYPLTRIRLTFHFQNLL